LLQRHQSVSKLITVNVSKVTAVYTVSEYYRQNGNITVTTGKL
jgi:hypothetical protein